MFCKLAFMALLLHSSREPFAPLWPIGFLCYGALEIVGVIIIMTPNQQHEIIEGKVTNS